MNRLLVAALLTALLMPLASLARANPGLPDLQVPTVSVTIPDPARPNRVHVEVTVTNRGDAPAGSFAIRWYPHQASNEVGCSIDAPGLSAGKQGKLRCDYTYVGTGQMHWRAVADEEAEIAESNENNNTATGAVSIGGTAPPPAAAGYDPYVRRMDFSPEPHQVGTTIQMWPMIATDSAPAGQPPFPASHFRWRTGPNFPWQEETCAADQHISSCLKTVSFTYDAPGTYVVEVQADNRNEVAETNENNNSRNWTLSVSGQAPSGPTNRPDLIILNPRFEPSPVVQGQPFKAAMTVQNIGGATASGPFIVLWDFPDPLGVEDCAWQIPELAPRTGITLVCDRSTNKRGQTTTQVTVDADNVVAEPDEVNNDVSVPMKIVVVSSDHPDPSAAKPDLLIEDAHFEPAHPLPNQPFTAVMTVLNDTSIDVTQPFRGLWQFTYQLKVADCNLTFEQGLKAGQRATVKCQRTTNAPPARYDSKPTVDADNVIAEEDEVNNDKPTVLTLYATDAPDVQGPPDLIVRNLQLSPNPVTHGKESQVEFEVANQGAGTAAASVAEWRTAPAGGLSFRCNVPKLEKGASHRCTWQFPAAPAKKNYGTTAIADVDKTVSESNEDNNSTKVTLQVK